MLQKNKKICFPRMGNYQISFRMLADMLDCEVVPMPPITKRTIELGFKYSPESACIPFKYNLGNFIEALDNGANVILHAGGGCRFGYYAEVQNEILKDLGYKFELVKINNSMNVFVLLQDLRKINPTLSFFRFARSFILAFLKLIYVEMIERFMRLNIGFEINEGEMENLFKKYMVDLDNEMTFIKIKNVYKNYLKQFKAIKIKKPKNPLRVGIVGELYVVMEPFSNFGIEKKLGKMGIEVHRFCTLSGILLDYVKNIFAQGYIRHMLKDAAPYLKYHVGAHGLESVAMAHKLAKEGFDGIIHVKPFGCMPEVNAMSALHKLSLDYKIPVVYFSFDSQTSETGINTRLEALYDMLVMRRNKKR